MVWEDALGSGIAFRAAQRRQSCCHESGEPTGLVVNVQSRFVALSVTLS
jgi:hypothetical protein